MDLLTDSNKGWLFVLPVSIPSLILLLLGSE